MHAEIYRSQTSKPVSRFVADFAKAASTRGFAIHNDTKMDMAHIFGQHGAEVAEGFDLHMIQICKPQKAAKSLSKNPERAVLMPKFVMTFSGGGATQIRFLRYGQALIAQLVDDPEFPASLAESFDDIIATIEEAK